MQSEGNSGLRRFISQVLCLSLLFQATGIAAALPLPPEKTYSELTADLSAGGDAEPMADNRWNVFSELLEGVWDPVSDGAEALRSWWQRIASPSRETPIYEPLQIARLGGAHPLPPRLMATLFAASLAAAAQSGPPSPKGLKSGERETVSESEMAFLAEKVVTEEIPLLPGFNLISLPEEPTNTDPAAIFAALGGQLQRVEAFDACDPADPEKIYDPADPAASDLTAVDHRMGLWVASTAATVLPSDGILAASTTIELCPGWNLIGFPAGEARHPQVALSSIAGKWERLFGYDAFDSADPWEIFDPAVPDWANDLRLMQPGRGYWLLVTEATTLEIRNEGPPPTVAINAPSDLAVITQPTEILGTVESDRLERWTLTYRGIGHGEATPIANGNTPVNNTSLGTFDPTLLLNGLYKLELTATDIQGQQVTGSIAVAVEGYMKIGHFRLSFLDLAIPVSGLDLEVIRTYDSRDKERGDFGFGWRLDLRLGSYQNNRPPGDGWQLAQSFLPCDTVQEIKSHLTVVRLSDREVYRFALRLQDGVPSIGGGCFATARFDLIDGPFVDATLEILGQTQVFWETGSDRVLDIDSLETYEPRQVQLRTRGGRVFDLDLAAGVTRLEDSNGNELSITPAGISHSSGLEIAFERDASGRIERILDLAGNALSYTYGEAGDLVRFTDRLSRTTAFGYAPGHLLESIRNFEDQEILTAAYAGDGRIEQQCDALARCTRLEHDLDERTQRRIDPTEVAETWGYDDRGNILRYVDGLSGEWAWEYNGRDRPTRRVDAAGGETVFEYDDRDNLIARTTPHRDGEDTADYTTRYAYDDNDRLRQVTLPGGIIWKLQHDGRGNLLTVTDPGGDAVYSATYDGQGNPLSEGSRFGSVRYEDLNAFGEPRRAFDVFGQATEVAYDALGSVTRIEEDGIVDTFEPDAFGRESRAVYSPEHQHVTGYDAQGRWKAQDSSFAGRIGRRFDLAGRLEAWEAPGGGEIAFERDAAGRLTARVDLLGRRAEFEYDAAGRMRRQVVPAIGEVLYGRDAAGRITRVTNALGHATELTYHPSGRLEHLRDPLDRQWSTSFGPGWSETTDPLSRTTRIEVGPEGELTRQVYPGGSEETVEYLAATPNGEREAYPTAFVDEAGRRRELSYNTVGQLATASDLAGASWSYAYDGPDLIGIEAPGGETVLTQTWNAERRPTHQTYGDGGTYAFAYGPGLEPTRITLPSGATLDRVYDVDGSLLSQTASSGETETYTYNAAGKQLTATGGAKTTTYGYDAGGRLESVSQSDGAAVQYQRDVLGRVTRVSVQGAADATVHATSYGYDAVGNLTSIEDPTGGTTEIEVDDVNRPIRRVLPNGLVSEWIWDDRDRVQAVVHRDAQGGVLASFTYTREATGEPSRIEREDGSAIELDYDGATRLIAERRYDVAGTLFEDNAWTYDTDGNRIREERAGTTYNLTYNPGFQLTEVTTAGTAVETYGFDTTGRVASIDRPGGDWTLTYDLEDQLVGATGSGGDQAYAYDAEGRRISATASGQTRRFVVAPALGDGLESAQLVREPARSTVYVWAGAAPLARFVEGGPVFYYLRDGLGSVIALADSAGNLVGTVDYNPFGAVRHTTIEPSDAGPGGDFRFRGEWLEAATGLYHLRARDYDPTTGRFLTRDPEPPDLRRPETAHPYVYAFSNPQLFSDPTGRFTVSEVNITFAAQRSLQGRRALAARQARDQIFETLNEGLTEYFLQWLEQNLGMGLAGWAIPEGLEFPKDGWKIGAAWEDAVTRTLCTVLGPAGQYLYFQPRIRQRDGAAIDDGLSCETRAQGGRRGGAKEGEREPDFLLRMAPPTADATTLITGEVKYSIHRFYENYYKPGDREGQWKAIYRHARKHGKPVKLTFLFAFSGSRKYQFNRMEKLVREARVAGVILTIKDPR